MNIDGLEYKKHDKKHMHTGEVRIPLYISRGHAFRKLCNDNTLGLLIHFLSYVVRGKNFNPEVDLYEEYYKKGFLATCWSQNKLAEKFEVTQQAIAKRVKKLESYGCLKVEHKIIHGKVQNVYVLGTVVESTVAGKKVVKEDIYAWKALAKMDLPNVAEHGA
jgi:DNA-binding MarR family transcriptional regulator